MRENEGDETCQLTSANYGLFPLDYKSPSK